MVCVLWVGDYNEFFIFLLLLILIYSGNIVKFMSVDYDCLLSEVGK